MTILAAAFCGGCSYSGLDKDGSRRIVGLATVRVLHPDTASPGAENRIFDTSFVGPYVTVSGFGVTINRHGDGANVAIGYSSETQASLRNYAQVDAPACVAEAAPLQETLGDWNRAPPEKVAGGRQYTGFVDIIIPPVPDCRSAGTFVDLEIVGVGFAQTAMGDSVDVGYGRATVAAVTSEALVIGDPMTDHFSEKLRTVDLDDRRSKQATHETREPRL